MKHGIIRGVLSCMVMTGTLAWAGAPEIPAVGESKMLTLVVREPPALRCNNNMQIAAELNNLYKIPFVVLPASTAPWSKAPAVYYGEQMIAEDGGDFNGMVGMEQMRDIVEIEAVARQDRPGRLIEVKAAHEALKAAIKGGK